MSRKKENYIKCPECERWIPSKGKCRHCNTEQCNNCTEAFIGCSDCVYFSNLTPASQEGGRMNSKIETVRKYASMLGREMIENINSDLSLLTMYKEPKEELDKIIKDRVEQRVKCKIFILKRIKSLNDFYVLPCCEITDKLEDLKDFEPKHYQHRLGEEVKLQKEMLEYIAKHFGNGKTPYEMYKEAFEARKN